MLTGSATLQLSLELSEGEKTILKRLVSKSCAVVEATGALATHKAAHELQLAEEAAKRSGLQAEALASHKAHEVRLWHASASLWHASAALWNASASSLWHGSALWNGSALWHASASLWHASASAFWHASAALWHASLWHASASAARSRRPCCSGCFPWSSWSGHAGGRPILSHDR